eukprot:58731-Rhodomonas_salina.1
MLEVFVAVWGLGRWVVVRADSEREGLNVFVGPGYPGIPGRAGSIPGTRVPGCSGGNTTTVIRDRNVAVLAVPLTIVPGTQRKSERHDRCPRVPETVLTLVTHHTHSAAQLNASEPRAHMTEPGAISLSHKFQ